MSIEAEKMPFRIGLRNNNVIFAAGVGHDRVLAITEASRELANIRKLVVRPKTDIVKDKPVIRPGEYEIRLVLKLRDTEQCSDPPKYEVRLRDITDIINVREERYAPPSKRQQITSFLSMMAGRSWKHDDR